jgi:hypothetical protein
MGDLTLCIVTMPTDRAVELAARIADAEDPDCEALLLHEGPQVCDALRCEVLHQADEIGRLRAIIEGRTTPPTDTEIAVHAARGGVWRTRYVIGEAALSRDVMGAESAGYARDAALPQHAYLWWALDSHGRPCAWPVVEVSK